MGKMERDINKLCMHFCPEGVDYYKLGELGKFYGGLTGKNKSDFSDGNAKFISYRNVYNNPALKLDVEDKVKISSNEKQNTLERGDIIFTGSSETADECGLSSVVTQDVNEKIYLNSFCFIFRFKNPKIILPDFSKHLFRSEYLRHQIGKTASGVTRFNVSKKLMANVTIPLPPLPIQQEIIRILDTFTNLTAELTAELTARRKQYEYYRDELLKTGEQVSLYEVAQYSKDRILASELTDENYVGVDNLLPNKQGKIKSEHTPIEGKFVRFVKEDILIGNIRPYLKKIWFSDCVGGTNGDVLTIRVIDKERVLPRFLYFVLSTESFFNYDMNNAKGAKMPRGDKKAVMNYQFYLPSLEIQEKVVSILETFDNLCNGFEYGLPAEIYARQQQYEYYRDELLNFKELHNKED